MRKNAPFIYSHFKLRRNVFSKAQPFQSHKKAITWFNAPSVCHYPGSRSYIFAVWDGVRKVKNRHGQVKTRFFYLFVQISGRIWTVVGRGYFSHASSYRENVASARRVVCHTRVVSFPSFTFFFMTNFSWIINIIEDSWRISFSQPYFWCLDIGCNRFNPRFDLREINLLSDGDRKVEARNARGSVTEFIFIFSSYFFSFFNLCPHYQVICEVIAGAWGKKF